MGPLWSCYLGNCHFDDELWNLSSEYAFNFRAEFGSWFALPQWNETAAVHRWRHKEKLDNRLAILPFLQVES